MKLQSKNGVALLLVMVSLALMAVISIEIVFASRVDIRIGRNARDRLQAYYLAQSAAKLSMLRLHMYKEVRNLVDQGGAAIPLKPEMIDKIWGMTLPDFPLSNSKIEWPGTISSRIESEGSKIPINLLDGNIHRGSSPEIAKQIHGQIANLIQGQLAIEEFDKDYRGLLAKDLIDPLTDWIDADSNKVEGGDEDQDYDRLDPPYHPRNDRMPTLSELAMVHGWTDDLIKRIGKQFSVLNTSVTINPNYISMERIRSIEPTLTKEDLSVIARRRLEKPFTNLKDLETFINTDPGIKNGRNFHFDPETMKDSPRETIFLIEATGVVGESRRTLKLGVRMSSEEKPPGAPSGTPPSGGEASGGGTQPSGGGTNPEKPSKLIEPLVVTVEESL